jgi:hypothetical protein
VGFHDPLAGSAGGEPHGSPSGVWRGGGQAAAPHPSANDWRIDLWLSDREVHPLVQWAAKKSGLMGALRRSSNLMRRMPLRVEEQLELVDRLGSKWREFSQSRRRYAPTNH